jgi:hypothetical protein
MMRSICLMLHIQQRIEAFKGKQLSEEAAKELIEKM